MPSGSLPEERALLERIIGNGLVDTGRALEPDNDQMFTWWAPWRDMKARNIGWRLDYVLATAPIFDKVEGCVIQREFGTSDHGPVVATFSGYAAVERCFEVGRGNEAAGVTVRTSRRAAARTGSGGPARRLNASAYLLEAEATRTERAGALFDDVGAW